MIYETLTKLPHVRGKKMKRIGNTEYKYVYIVSYDDIKTYTAEIPSLRFYKSFADVREAAKTVDIELIKNGKEPINILKKK